MLCPSCKHENRAGRRFCVHCGAGLELSCPSCGASAAARRAKGRSYRKSNCRKSSLTQVSHAAPKSMEQKGYLRMIGVST